MLFTKQNRIKRLQARCARLEGQLSKAVEERDSARWLVTHRAMSASMADAWSAEAVDHAVRIGRLARGAARYLGEIGRLRRLVAEQDEVLSDPRFAADRAIRPAVPTPETERLRRELRQANALVESQQEQILRYQSASEATDLMLAEARAALDLANEKLAQQSPAVAA
ncbi:hypothetical protein GCM10010193_69420 [Kitasatospora atroaurantiaca]|uniref:Uncharacterized protein n=1 Tax=Kitasatospora atroaurantiaca TaxID=285545 RepID=A0A561EN84_9ACTN|nr:hypothetical protein [Kitasatospora atroaurantiaca]TWE17029.1 hypothetical protein FB465_2033 [Kitasatospora atroaurantiaca]